MRVYVNCPRRVNDPSKILVEKWHSPGTLDAGALLPRTKPAFIATREVAMEAGSFVAASALDRGANRELPLFDGPRRPCRQCN